jgi:GTPase involved in cell partitioning and DNA repair
VPTSGGNGNRVAFCRKEMGVGGPQEGGGKEGGAAAMVVEQEDVAVEAAWDVDDDDH